MRPSNILSTGEIADICGVAVRTVSKWIDSGQLKGWRLPGSLDRRVYRDELLRFIAGSGMPLPPEFSRTVLLVGPDAKETADTFARAGWGPVLADSAFLAGLRTAEAHPAAIVVDMSDGLMTAEAIRWGADPVPVVLLGEHGRWTGQAAGAADVVSVVEGAVAAGHDGRRKVVGA